MKWARARLAHRAIFLFGIFVVRALTTEIPSFAGEPTGTVGADEATVNTALVSGLSYPTGIAVDSAVPEPPPCGANGPQQSVKPVEPSRQSHFGNQESL